MFLTVVSITQPFAFVLKKTDISTRRKKSVLQILNRFPNDFTAFCGKVARFFHIFHRISVRFSGFLPKIQTFNFVFNNLWKENASKYAIF